MKVVLLQDVDGIGKRYDIKTVSDGYARNYLIPRGFAKPATEQLVQTVETHKSVEQTRMETAQKRLQEVAESIKGKDFHFYVQIGNKGELFGSVSKDDIRRKLTKETGLADGEIIVHLARQIKQLGSQSVEIEFAGGIKVNINAVVNQLVLK